MLGLLGMMIVHEERGLALLGGASERTTPSKVHVGCNAHSRRTMVVSASPILARAARSGCCLGSRPLERATEQALEADEAPLVLGCGVEIGCW